MEWKRANSEQFELRQIQMFEADFHEDLWRFIKTSYHFIERAFQRHITCTIWMRDERDMQFWKSVRARTCHSVAAPKTSAAAPVFWQPDSRRAFLLFCDLKHILQKTNHTQNSSDPTIHHFFWDFESKRGRKENSKLRWKIESRRRSRSTHRTRFFSSFLF